MQKSNQPTCSLTILTALWISNVLISQLSFTITFVDVTKHRHRHIGIRPNTDENCLLAAARVLHPESALSPPSSRPLATHPHTYTPIYATSSKATAYNSPNNSFFLFSFLPATNHHLHINTFDSISLSRTSDYSFSNLWLQINVFCDY